MTQPIIFYDLSNEYPLGSAERSWSPNTLKTRLSLNYKKLPYKTVWVEFADAQAINKQIGATPTTKYPDGTPRYTLPTIHDPNTGKIVSESHAIARYLDEQYPERPLMVKSTEEKQGEYANAADIGGDALMLCMNNSRADLAPRNSKAIENLYPDVYASLTAPDRSKPVPEKALKGFIGLADSLAEVKKSLGLSADSIAFVDLVAMGYLRWFQITVHNEEIFNKVLQLDGGKCQKIYDRMKDYLAVDKGEDAVLQA